MPHIDKDPIGLTKPEIFSVIAFLQKMSGEPISIKVEDVMESQEEQTEAVEVAFNANSVSTSSVLAESDVAP